MHIVFKSPIQTALLFLTLVHFAQGYFPLTIQVLYPVLERDNIAEEFREFEINIKNHATYLNMLIDSLQTCKPDSLLISSQLFQQAVHGKLRQSDTSCGQELKIAFVKRIQDYENLNDLDFSKEFWILLKWMKIPQSNSASNDNASKEFEYTNTNMATPSFILKFEKKYGKELLQLTNDYVEGSGLQGSVKCEIVFDPQLLLTDVRFSDNLLNYPGKTKLLEADIRDMRIKIPKDIYKLGYDGAISTSRNIYVRYTFDFDHPTKDVKLTMKSYYLIDISRSGR